MINADLNLTNALNLLRNMLGDLDIRLTIARQYLMAAEKALKDIIDVLRKASRTVEAQQTAASTGVQEIIDNANRITLEARETMKNASKTTGGALPTIDDAQQTTAKALQTIIETNAKCFDEVLQLILNDLGNAQIGIGKILQVVTKVIVLIKEPEQISGELNGKHFIDTCQRTKDDLQCVLNNLERAQQMTAFNGKPSSITFLNCWKIEIEVIKAFNRAKGGIDAVQQFKTDLEQIMGTMLQWMSGPKSLSKTKIVSEILPQSTNEMIELFQPVNIFTDIENNKESEKWTWVRNTANDLRNNAIKCIGKGHASLKCLRLVDDKFAKLNFSFDVAKRSPYYKLRTCLSDLLALLADIKVSDSEPSGSIKAINIDSLLEQWNITYKQLREVKNLNAITDQLHINECVLAKILEKPQNPASCEPWGVVTSSLISMVPNIPILALVARLLQEGNLQFNQADLFNRTDMCWALIDVARKIHESRFVTYRIVNLLIIKKYKSDLVLKIVNGLPDEVLKRILNSLGDAPTPRWMAAPVEQNTRSYIRNVYNLLNRVLNIMYTRADWFLHMIAINREVYKPLCSKQRELIGEGANLPISD
jgi:hypothetical protein